MLQNGGGPNCENFADIICDWCIICAWWRYAQMRQFLPPKGSEMAGQSMELTLACVHTATGSRKAKW